VRAGELGDLHGRVIETAKGELFARAMRKAQGNQTKAARWLGVTRATMKARMVQFSLHFSIDGQQERPAMR
jgi:DNA-binding protein Fis